MYVLSKRSVLRQHVVERRSYVIVYPSRRWTLVMRRTSQGYIIRTVWERISLSISISSISISSISSISISSLYLLYLAPLSISSISSISISSLYLLYLSPLSLISSISSIYLLYLLYLYLLSLSPLSISSISCLLFSFSFYYSFSSLKTMAKHSHHSGWNVSTTDNTRRHENHPTRHAQSCSAPSQIIQCVTCLWRAYQPDLTSQLRQDLSITLISDTPKTDYCVSFFVWCHHKLISKEIYNKSTELE